MCPYEALIDGRLPVHSYSSKQKSKFSLFLSNVKLRSETKHKLKLKLKQVELNALVANYKIRLLSLESVLLARTLRTALPHEEHEIHS